MDAQNLKILMIDDDEDDFILVRDVINRFEGEEFQIEWVGSHKEAMARIQEDQFDLYLVDYNLGPKIGTEFIQEAQELGVDQPMILLTGMSGIDIDHQGMAAGAWDFLPKNGLAPEVLERSIRYAVKHYSVLKELKKAKTTAEEATLLKDKFISLVSHDLKNPFSNIQSILNIIREAEEGEHSPQEISHFINLGITAANQAQDLIQDLLNVERFKTGKLKPNFEFISLPLLCSNLAQRLKQDLEKKRLTLKLEIPAGAVAFSDIHLLSEVIHNLLANAIKFSHQKSQITLTVEMGSCALIKICDTGVGIPEDMLSDIFKYEVKTSRTGTEGELGTGFGLPLSYEIVQGLKGELSVTSEIDQGSCFLVSLPSEAP